MDAMMEEGKKFLTTYPIEGLLRACWLRVELVQEGTSGVVRKKF